MGKEKPDYVILEGFWGDVEHWPRQLVDDWANLAQDHPDWEEKPPEKMPESKYAAFLARTTVFLSLEHSYALG